MILKHWSDLAGVIGQIEGMATAIEWAGEEIDPKKIKSGLDDVKTKLQAIFEAEREKLEDVSYKKDDKKADKPKEEKK